MIPARCLCILLGLCCLLGLQTPAQPTSLALGQVNVPSSPLSSRDQELAQRISTSEWLGPLAPIAISPFFGITCLSGIAQFGEGLLPTNEFVSDNPVLKSPFVFWIFLVLTLLTSLPRLTKVSKPLAQAIDQLEAWAGIIVVLVLRFAVSVPDPDTEVQVVQMGILSFSSDVLLSVAAIINIVVINSVKFFFEVMVWLIPIPFVDAVLEVCNKALCAGLMAIYAWSPLAATVVNLILFGACLLAFNWVKRRVTFLRTMLTEPLCATLFAGFGKPSKKELNCFAQQAFECFPAKSRILVRPTETGWQLTEPRWIFPDRMVELPRGDFRLVMQEGILVNSIQIQASSETNEDMADETLLYFSRRFNDHLDDLASLIEVERSAEKVEIAVQL